MAATNPIAELGVTVRSRRKPTCQVLLQSCPGERLPFEMSRNEGCTQGDDR